MQKLITALGTEIEILWAGVSTIDGTFRFMVADSDFDTVYSIFSKQEHTKMLTHVFDESGKIYEGFTTLFRIEKMPMGGIVVGMKGA